MRKVQQLLHRHQGNVAPSQAQVSAAPLHSGYNSSLPSGVVMASTQPGTGLMGSSGSMLHPFASQYNLPPHVANWQQGQPIPQGWRLGRRGFLKPAFVLPSQYSSWQQGQPLPQGYRLSKRGTLRPVNYWNWWQSNSGNTQLWERSTVIETDVMQQAPMVRMTAPEVEVREKAPVVQEVIKGTVREEIQPVIHREREQLEIREEVQPIYERSVRPTLVEQRALAAEIRPEVRLGSMPVIAEGPKSSVFVEAEHREAVMHAPIIEEVVHKKIIEEVQPVIHREVLAPRIINERKDIYEKIVEAPTVSYTTLAPQFVGSMTSTTVMQHPYMHMLPPHVASWQQGQALPQGWRLGRKGYLKPAFVLPSHLSSWQQGQPLPQGYRLSKRGSLRPVNYFDWYNSSYGGMNKMQQAGNASFVPMTIQRY